MIFVDTSAWFAAVIASDPNHRKAQSWLTANQAKLTTTDYIVDETLTLLRARGQTARALVLGQELFAASRAALHFLTESDIRAAWDVYRKFQDKDWSFTDCTSKVVIEKLGLASAFSFDHHFFQFGSVVVVP